MNCAGAETLILNIYRNIDRKRIQFDFVVHTDEQMDYEKEIYSLGGKIFRAPRFNGENTIKYIKSWNCFFQDHPEYKIVHGHLRGSAVFYLAVAKKRGLITIMHSHSTSNGAGLRAFAKNMLKVPLKHFVDYYLACSAPAATWLFGQKILSNPAFHLLKNAIPLENYCYDEEIRDRIRKELGISDKYVIGHVGRFNQVKNHKFLLDILKQITRRESNVKLILIGDGDLFSDIQLYAKKIEVEDYVLFLGVQKNVSKFLQAMDIFAFPSRYEGLGISLVEAQVSGLKVVCSTGVPKEVDFTENVKFISLKESSELWAKELLLYKDGYPRRTQGREAREAGYDIKEAANFLQDFYENILREE